MSSGKRALARAALLAVLLSGPPAVPSAAAGDGGDEAWIDAWMQREDLRRAAGEQGEGLPFAELGRLLGDPVRVWLADGRVRRGIVERADGRSATLRAQAPTGYFSFTVERGQVSRLERIGTP